MWRFILINTSYYKVVVFTDPLQGHVRHCVKKQLVNTDDASLPRDACAR